MSLYDDFIKSAKDEVIRREKYPVIWKITKCSSYPEYDDLSKCVRDRLLHRWSVPQGTAMGLMAECYDCHKTRFVKVDSEPDVWVNRTASKWVAERLNELNSR